MAKKVNSETKAIAIRQTELTETQVKMKSLLAKSAINLDTRLKEVNASGLNTKKIHELNEAILEIADRQNMTPEEIITALELNLLYLFFHSNVSGGRREISWFTNMKDIMEDFTQK